MDSQVLIIVGVAAAAALVLLGWVIVRKGRKRAGDHVYRASRLSKGNRIFPSQVIVSPTSITHLRPQLIGRLEKSIHMAHVASIRIDTNLIFSDVFIETTGGQNPIACYGHFKGEAVKLKAIIEEYQSGYYQRQERSGERATRHPG
jgi:hypothetical protein